MKISTDYLCSDGILLVKWTRRQRKKYHERTLKKKYLNALEETGFMEILETNEERGLSHAMQYYKKFHNLGVPCAYVCEDGYRLGIWIRIMREHKHKLPKKTQNQLNKIGMIWSVPKMNWLMIFNDCEQYFMENGHLNMPYKYKSKSGFYLR